MTKKSALGAATFALVLPTPFGAHAFPGDGADFFTVSPCRLVDTRLPAGPLGGPALVGGADRVFALTGSCGVAATAASVAVNVTVTGSTTAGHLRFHPGGTPVPTSSVINFTAGQTRANNALVPLSAAGDLAVFVGGTSGTVHFVLDVNGYFEPPTSAGTEFFLTLPDHLCVSLPGACSDPPSARLRIAAKAATSGQVLFDGTAIPFTVAAGGDAVVELPIAAVLTSNETVEAKGIHVTALAPVSVHAIVEAAGVSDGYLALPAAQLGLEHLVVSRSDPGIAGSVFAVAAARDSTTVTITPTAAGATRPPGQAFSVALDAGETYQFENPAFADLTGTLVASNKPVAVFSGHRCARIPSGTGFCEYLVEQLPDAARLGKRHHLVPFSGRTRYTAVVLGIEDGTSLTYDPPQVGAPSLVQRGQSAGIVVTTPVEIASTKRVLVAQFMHGSEDDVVPSGGDPSMVAVTPAEQGVHEAAFSVHGLSGGSGAFLSIVTATSAVPTLELDGTLANPTLFAAIGSSGFSAASIPVGAGAHMIRGSAPFTGVAYGYGAPSAAMSYSYPVPRALAVLPP